MRKKSHIALSAFLVGELRLTELDIHRKAFYFGSIQPDLNPKMLSEPHEFDATWEKIQQMIREIERETCEGNLSSRTIWLQTGVVLHYLADYFTYPHNSCYEGNIKGHCQHESELKYLLRAYLATSEARASFRFQCVRARKIHTANQLSASIENAHELYMRENSHSVYDDCQWITTVCFCAGAVLARMVCGEEQRVVWPGCCVA